MIPDPGAMWRQRGAAGLAVRACHVRWGARPAQLQLILMKGD
jgi:hypothetical protein